MVIAVDNMKSTFIIVTTQSAPNHTASKG